jgi:hypothetical protein
MSVESLSFTSNVCFIYGLVIQKFEDINVEVPCQYFCNKQNEQIGAVRHKQR